MMKEKNRINETILHRLPVYIVQKSHLTFSTISWVRKSQIFRFGKVMLTSDRDQFQGTAQMLY
jgi:hypothetical protein